MPFAIQVDPATRQRVERIWQRWNKVAGSGEMPWPTVSKNGMYRALLAYGAAAYEDVLGLRVGKRFTEFPVKTRLIARLPDERSAGQEGARRKRSSRR